MADSNIKQFISGTHSVIDPENIPNDAAQDSSNWLTKDGVIEIVRGRELEGDQGLTGKVYNDHWGYKIDGTKVHYRKANGKIQVEIASVWTDVVTGLTATAKYTFSNYQSLAGTYVFATGVDGIYKISTANPTSYISLYDSAKNFKGKSIINIGRMLMWNLPTDKTGLYGSRIDSQTSLNYTTITGEATTSLTGTLAFKAGVFTVTIASPGVFTSVAHGHVANDRIVFATTGALPTGLTAGTTYYVIATGLTADSFQVSTTLGGSAVNTSGSQSGVHSIVDANQRNCFGVTITLTGTGEIFTDNFDGTLTGSISGTGTINYITGAYTLSNAGVGTVTYQWENSNFRNITDFTKSATRVAAEGFVFRQDDGGDPIMQVLVAVDGSYISMKQQSVYQLILEPTDTVAVNKVFRKDVGMSSSTGAISTGIGILFMNTANPSKPELTILEKNPLGDNLQPRVLFPQYQFNNFTYDSDTVVSFFDRYVVVSCKSNPTRENDTLLLCNVNANTVDRTYYGLSCISTNNGYLYGGSCFELTNYKIFIDFDDLGEVIENYWISKSETYDNENLKRFKKIRLKGLIQAAQSYSVEIDYDNIGFQLVGTILGNGNYVDYGNPQLVGAHLVGQAQIGGTNVTTYPYFTEIKLRKCPKFRNRKIRLTALGIGYVSVDTLNDWNIDVYENRLPKGARQKQHVNLAGTPTNQNYASS